MVFPPRSSKKFRDHGDAFTRTINNIDNAQIKVRTLTQASGESIRLTALTVQRAVHHTRSDARKTHVTAVNFLLTRISAANLAVSN
jgi:hypothetical protein